MSSNLPPIPRIGAKMATRKRKLPSRKRLLELFECNTKDGTLMRRLTRGSTAVAGSIAGYEHGNGYLRVNVDMEKIFVHRIIWFIATGRWPKNQIDHKNMIRDDNRFCNLREANKAQNAINSGAPANNTSGVRGVRFHGPRGKWTATIKVKQKNIYLGYFMVFEQAVSARMKAEKKFFGEFSPSK